MRLIIFPDTLFFILGGLLGSTKLVKTAIWSEESNMPVNHLGKTSSKEKLGNVTLGVDSGTDDHSGTS